MSHGHEPECPDAIKNAVEAYNRAHPDDVHFACATEEFVRDNAHLHDARFNQMDRNFVLVIITVLIVAGVAFERGLLAWAKRRAVGALRPIIDALLAEVCMLGVLGMTLYITVHKTNILNNVSESYYDNPNHLIHLLEDVHFAMFAVIVVLLVQAFYMVWYARKRARQWEHANAVCQEDPDELVRRYVEAQSSGFNRLFGSEESEQIKFAALRRRFVFAEKGAKREVPADFEFHEYLSAIMGETVGEAVEIPISVWLLLEMTCVVVWALFYDEDLDFHVQDYILYLVGLTTLFCGFLAACYEKMRRIEGQLVAPYLYNRADREAATSTAAKTETSKLNKEAKQGYDAQEGDPSELPPFLQPGAEARPGVGPDKCVARLCCVHQHPMGKHLSLFPFGPEGPEFFLRVCQLSMVYSSMYFGFFLCQIRKVWNIHDGGHGHGHRRLLGRALGGLGGAFGLGAESDGEVSEISGVSGPGFRGRALQEGHGHGHGHGHGVHIPEYWIDTTAESLLVTALVAGPPLFMLWLLPKMLQKLVNISSVEELKHHHVITEVRREAATRKAIRAMKLLRCMKSSFKKNAKVKDPNATHAVVDRQSAQIVAKRDEIKEMFDVFDASGDGDIDKDELAGLLKLMNMPASAGTVDEILHQIDTDNSGVIDFEEFFEWYLDHLYSPGGAAEEEDVEGYVRDMFAMLHGEDAKAEEIQYEAFARAMSQVGGGIPEEDVRAIFNEIDEDKSGEISLEELTEFITKHADGL